MIRALSNRILLIRQFGDHLGQPGIAPRSSDGTHSLGKIKVKIDTEILADVVLIYV